MSEDPRFVAAKEICRKAGQLLKESYTADAKVESSQGKDIKTEADRAAETLILSELSRFGIPILSEESGESQSFNTLEEYWVVDPLDGTYNFVRGFPMFCVSLALWRGREPVFGVIFDFFHDQMYAGEVGEGAWINNTPIRVSSTSSKASATLSTGFPSKRSYDTDSLSNSIERIQQFKKIRMIGSAAMSLANVARGVFDAYFEEDIWFWDVAAGVAIISAAGGEFNISNVKENWQMNVYAGNGILKL